MKGSIQLLGCHDCGSRQGKSEMGRKKRKGIVTKGMELKIKSRNQNTWDKENLTLKMYPSPQILMLNLVHYAL
jgi:hypothetical protein